MSATDCARAAPPRLARSALLRAAAVLAASALLSACVTKRLRMDFATFSDDYANNLNWQMLLNLARLDQGHPAYFMAIGEIRLSRSQTGNLQGSGSGSDTDQTADALNTGTLVRNVTTTATNVLTGNLTGSATLQASPTFVFIPINSEEAARQLLAPISIDVFNTLYQQGWPVDQLLRVLVERIEVTFDHSAKPIVLTNSPTRGSPESFSRFLRACDVVRKLQQAGGLMLVSDEQFRPLGGVEVERARLAVRDIADAVNRSRTWRQTPDGAYELGTMRTIFRFQADPRVLDETLAALGLEGDSATPGADADVFASEARRSELLYLKKVFAAGLLVAPSVTEESAARALGANRDAAAEAGEEEEAADDSASESGGRSPGPGAGAIADDSTPRARPRHAAAADRRAAREGGVRTVLILRSFRNLLEAVAQEQRAFDELAQDRDFLAGLPRRQRRPVLRTDWNGQTAELRRPVVTLQFAGTSYEITDPVGSAASLDSRWNRDVFGLLINLSSQVTVDITKFQRQVLELTQ